MHYTYVGNVRRRFYTDLDVTVQGQVRHFLYQFGGVVYIRDVLIDACLFAKFWVDFVMGCNP